MLAGLEADEHGESAEPQIRLVYEPIHRLILPSGGDPEAPTDGTYGFGVSRVVLAAYYGPTRSVPLPAADTARALLA